MTKNKKTEAIEILRDALADCGPTGDKTLHIRHMDGRATDTGRSDYFDVCIWGVHNGRPEPIRWIVPALCEAGFGYRFNKAREAVAVFGCDFNKAHDIAYTLARIVGHPVFVQGDYSGMVEG